MPTVDLLFTNARLIDGTGSPACEGSWLAVDKGKVHSIGSGGAPAPAAATVVDATGKTLMPGLIDAHTHPGNLDPDINKVPPVAPALFVHRVSRVLEDDLKLGFTTLRDACGLERGFREATEQGHINGPRLFLSISPLSQTAGHGDKRPWYIDGPQVRNSLGVGPMICDSPDAMRHAAREVLRKGADQVKIMADGGVASPGRGPGMGQFSVPEMRAAVEVAEMAGTYVMAHVYSSIAVQRCLEAGVRSIEHANLIDRDTAEMIAEREAYLVPTLTVFEVLAEKREELGFTQHYLDKLDQVREHSMRALEYAHKAGARIASGADLIGSAYQKYKGRELALKAKVMGAMGAIVSATLTSAQLLQVEDKLGTLEKGKIADCILVAGNPLEDLSMFEPDSGKVRMVVKDGRVAWDADKG